MPALRFARSSRPSLHEVGENPDYRFTLANERTFLAWVRTSLALMAAGVAVAQFVEGLVVVRHLLGVVLITLGGVVAAAAYRHWERNERAMRLGERLPHSSVPRVVASSLALVTFAALAVVVYGLAS